jgi:hypothetical protein
VQYIKIELRTKNNGLALDDEADLQELKFLDWSALV